MKKIKKYFGNYEMTWRKVILFSVITAVYTALINEIPFLKDTSFQDIAVNLECWILFAVFIVINCNKWWEASLKCFVFFLIGQPLIYLIEVPFEQSGWGIFGYYPHWLAITVLTLPGAAIAFLLKKKNLLSVAVLSVANAFLAYVCADYAMATSTHFPHHLLSAVFCLALAVFFVFVLLDRKTHRIIALCIIAATLAVSLFLGLRERTVTVQIGDGNWFVSVSDESVADIKLKENGTVTVTARKNGYANAVFENSDGDHLAYHITVSGGKVWLSADES